MDRCPSNGRRKWGRVLTRAAPAVWTCFDRVLILLLSCKTLRAEVTLLPRKFLRHRTNAVRLSRLLHLATPLPFRRRAGRAHLVLRSIDKTP